MRKKKAETIQLPDYSQFVIETFKSFGHYDKNQLCQKEPSCFNSDVRFKKYKVSVELIEEPIEEYQKRLQELWDICDNHHHWFPLRSAAKSIGYTFIGDAGSKREKR